MKKVDEVMSVEQAIQLIKNKDPTVSLLCAKLSKMM